MKKLLLTLTMAALTTSVWAAQTVTLANVHLCCASCVKGVEKVAAKAKDATFACDKDAGTVTITAPDAKAAQKAVDALVAAGYYGKSSDAAVKAKSNATGSDAKVQKLTLNGVHLCCGKCVTAVDKAIKGVKGVTGHTAEKNAASFEVTGDFSAKEVLGALEKAGLSGKAGK
ncbi:MAG: hypothetical protein HZA89_14800 [Verrucomicrobia bacterium]|nr:hypothetical protein [Verrucomicrobiota bacterium]